MNHVGTSVLLALDNQFCFALHSAARRMQRAYQPLLGELSLTYPQYLVMLVLWEWEHAREARPTVRALGERLDLDSGTLTPLLRRLEHKRLVIRTRTSDDGRELFVRVTRRGSALKERASTIPLRMIASSPLPVNELVALREQLKRLRAGMASTQENSHEND
jgi:MarR family transcriptional regulator, organic hydroperoxide resistance regulator